MSTEDKNRPKDKNHSLAMRPDDLLESQTPAIRGILDRICEIAAKISEPGQAHRSDAIANDDRPHYAFLIDGGRGSGKTFTLLTIWHVLRGLNGHPSARIDQTGESTFQDFLYGSKAEAAQADAKAEAKQKWKKLDHADALRSAVADRRASGLETIKIIFPGDMVGGDSVMESVFAEISERITSSLTTLDAQARSGGSKAITESMTKFKDLARRLREDVEQGWYFARRFGLEPLYRDSLDYEDLVQRWGDQVKRASFRIDNWRKFIRDFLDANEKSALVVMIDDSDVRPDLTEDVLHSIRMFLNHPRIIIVLAGNLKSMRDALVYQAMKRIGPSIDALNQDKHPSATEWRRRERQQIEEYLEKVLPPAQRYYISPPRTLGARRGATSGSKDTTDFEKIALRKIEEYANNAQSFMRLRFLDAKFRLALHHELARPDAPQPRDRTSLEMFLGWWIFGNVYADTLTPTSARQIATFRDYFEAFQNEPENDKHRAAVAYQSRKRLPVALFDTPSNHVMIQRLGDDDTSVSDWLRRQQLGSDWSARRTLILNQREIHESSFTYNYLCYRLDLGLALPVRDNVDEVIPTELLPQPVGRKHMRRFFQPRQMPRRQRRLGVSRWIDHAAIPGNCMYFHDLRTIANISCYSPKEHAGTLESLQSGGWEAQLADKWFELIEDRRESAEDEHLLRYFREIVCESLRHTEHISTATLINELDPPDIYQKQLFSIYEHFITDEIGAFTATSLERRKLWLGAFPGGHREVELKETNKQLDEEFEATPGFLPRLFKTDETLDTDLDEAASWSPRAPRRMIALYSALITDLRRAWQAMRLYGAARVVMGGVTPDGGSETGSIPSLSVIANRDRMQLYKRNDIENLLKRSPWILELLKVFDQENIHKTFVEWEKKKGQSLKVATDIGIPEIQRIFEARDGLEEQVQSEEEPRDFRSWTRTLRAIGRSVCHRWPAHHVDKDGTEFEVDLENDLFANANSDDPKAHLLKIFDKLEKEPSGSEPKFRNATEAKEYEDKRKAYNNERRRQNARSARNFVWLMYGLAPSLPAVIHAHIMSQIYEAELNVRAFKDATRAGRSSYLYKQKDKFAKQARELYSFESEKNSDSGSKANKRRLGAIQEVEEWAKLIGTLSIMLRYIKIKCLHLDTTLIFREKTEQNPDEIIALLERTKFTIATPKRPDKDASQAERDAFEEKDKHWREKFRDLFSKKVCEQFTEERIADGLAIFPDVSPSTLFGDDWLTDILSRRGLSQSLLKSMSGSSLEYRITGLPPENKDGEDDPLSVNGIFGETEQWLWSANRTLRKLRAKLQKRYTAVDIALGSTGGGISDPPASPSSASVEGTQQPGASIANTQQPPTA